MTATPQSALVEALRLSADALETLIDADRHQQLDNRMFAHAAKAAGKARAALAHAAAQAEPVQQVGHVRIDSGEVHFVPKVRDADATALADGQPLYTTPPLSAPSEQPNLACKSVQARLAAQWGYVPAPSAAEQPLESGAKLWLWKNGDHYLAFRNLYPCFSPGGDPMTLGEPAAWAEFRESYNREGKPNEQQRTDGQGARGGSHADLQRRHAAGAGQAHAVGAGASLGRAEHQATPQEGWIAGVHGAGQRALSDGAGTIGGLAAQGYSAAGLAQAPAQPAPVAVAPSVVAALRFYAQRQHFAISDRDAWDTVSGEPQNYWCDEAGTATVEDGAIARIALEGLSAAPTHTPAATDAGAAQWQPIETAPKDGTAVFCFWTPAAGKTHAGCYGVAEFTAGRWHNPEDEDDLYIDPTHWMPLPPPPSAQVSAAEQTKE